MTDADISPRGWRYTLGFWMFTIPFVLIIATPIIVPFFVKSATEAAAIIGGVVLVGEIVWFASIPLLGKAGFKELKNKAFGFLALSKGPIGRNRHNWGIRLLGLGVLLETLVLIGLVFGYFYLGETRLDQPLIGNSFETEARIFIGLVIASALCVISGLYAAGLPFVERLEAALKWQDDENPT